MVFNSRLDSPLKLLNNAAFCATGYMSRRKVLRGHIALSLIYTKKGMGFQKNATQTFTLAFIYFSKFFSIEQITF